MDSRDHRGGCHGGCSVRLPIAVAVAGLAKKVLSGVVWNWIGSVSRPDANRKGMAQVHDPPVLDTTPVGKACNQVPTGGGRLRVSPMRSTRAMRPNSGGVFPETRGAGR